LLSSGNLAVAEGLSMLRLTELLKDKRAATAVEYGLIAALIVLAMLASLNTFANVTTGMWNNVSNQVSKH
jgi:pilus assembly protein Flp/PilA